PLDLRAVAVRRPHLVDRHAYTADVFHGVGIHRRRVLREAVLIWAARLSHHVEAEERALGIAALQLTDLGGGLRCHLDGAGLEHDQPPRVASILDHVGREKVVVRFAAADQTRATLFDYYDGGPRHHVVVARHRKVVRARDGDRYEISRDRTRHANLANEHITRFAVAPRDRERGLGGVLHAIGEHGGVFRAVSGRSDVVRHAAVDGDVCADARELLY